MILKYEQFYNKLAKKIYRNTIQNIFYDTIMKYKFLINYLLYNPNIPISIHLFILFYKLYYIIDFIFF